MAQQQQQQQQQELRLLWLPGLLDCWVFAAWVLLLQLQQLLEEKEQSLLALRVEPLALPLALLLLQQQQEPPLASLVSTLESSCPLEGCPHPGRTW